jgi:hypothetical protein
MLVQLRNRAWEILSKFGAVFHIDAERRCRTATAPVRTPLLAVSVEVLV